MKALTARLMLVLAAVLPAAALAATDDAPPAWAYPVNPPDFKLPPDDGKPRHVPDSAATFTVGQTRDRFFAPDWHPADHPAMPAVVAYGRKPDVLACGFCHRADGPGGPENASLAGLPAAYIVRQMIEFKSGARKTSVPERAPVKLMTVLSGAASDAEIDAAAAYFSALNPKITINVVETDTVPRTYVAGWFLADMKSGEREAIANRIIEVPEDLGQFENRDARSRFIAYVPPGSIGKGEALAATGGNGRTVPCAPCHGAGLRGLGLAPAIAGRSPSYFVRQLYDLQHGARAGDMSALMTPTVEKLSLDDMIALAAYVASLEP